MNEISVASLLALGRKLPDVEAARVVLTQANAMQGEIRAAAIYYAASTDTGPEDWALRFNVVLLFPK